MGIKDHINNKNLKSSYFTGIFGCSMTGFTQEFFTPFLLLLGGTARHVGMMHFLNNACASLIQLFSPELTVRFSRKRVVSVFVFLQTIILTAIVLMTLYPGVKPSFFIITVILFTVSGALTLPCWLSLLSDLVQPTRRGAYFGWRGRTLGYTAVTVTSMAGFILYLLEGHNKFAGFTIIFTLAFLCRLISWFFVKKVAELPLQFDKSDHFSFIKFIRRYKESNFVRFAVFVSAMNFSVNLAAPFFAVFMLKDLKFNYLLFTLINIAAPLMLYSTILRWGKHADQVGNVKVLKVIAPFIGCIPLLWIINQNPLFLIFAEIVSGFLWAGFNLCASNFIMDAVIPSKRTRCLAYFSFMNGTALALGAMTGGFLIRILPPLFHYKILTLFLISAVLRILVGIIFPLPIKEVRKVTDISRQELLFSMIGVKPIAGIDQETIQI